MKNASAVILNSLIYLISIFLIVVNFTLCKSNRSRMEINKDKSRLVYDFFGNVIESAACLVAALLKLGFDLDWI